MFLDSFDGIVILYFNYNNFDLDKRKKFIHHLINSRKRQRRDCFINNDYVLHDYDHPDNDFYYDKRHVWPTEHRQHDDKVVTFVGIFDSFFLRR